VFLAKKNPSRFQQDKSICVRIGHSSYISLPVTRWPPVMTIATPAVRHLAFIMDIYVFAIQFIRNAFIVWF